MLSQISSPDGVIWLGYGDAVVELVPTRKGVVTVHMDKGEVAIPAALLLKQAFQWASEQLKARKVVAFIPSRNTPALHAAAHAGMQREGYSPLSYYENDMVDDLIYYGVELCHKH